MAVSTLFFKAARAIGGASLFWALIGPRRHTCGSQTPAWLLHACAALVLQEVVVKVHRVWTVPCALERLRLVTPPVTLSAHASSLCLH